jgi:branched-chain amino acid transport system substrate-binding protein
MKTAAFGRLAALAMLLAMPHLAWAQVKVGVVFSSTGPVAFVGIAQKNSIAMLPKRVGDTAIEYIFYDDTSDPTQTVQIGKKFFSEHRVDAIIGPSGTPNALALIPFLAEAQTPILAPVGSAAVVTPMDDKKRWVFKPSPNDDVMAEGLVEHMRKRGVRTLGFIGYSDPYGDSWHSVFGALAQKAGMQIVANERYARADTSVVGQVVRIMGAKPDAVLVAGVSAGAVPPHEGLIEKGYKGLIYHTQGSSAGDFIKVGKKNVEGALISASIMLVVDELPDSNPSKQIAQRYVREYEKTYGNRPPIFGAAVFDAGQMLGNAIPQALKRARPGTTEFRIALRDALESTRNLVVSLGVMNITPTDHAGYDSRSRVMVTVKDGRFTTLRD